MKSKVIEAEVGKCGNWKTRDTDTDAIPASSLSLFLSLSWLQFDSEGLRRWIPRRPSLERVEDGGKERERVGWSELARPRVSLQLPQIPRY